MGHAAIAFGEGLTPPKEAGLWRSLGSVASGHELQISLAPSEFLLQGSLKIYLLPFGVEPTKDSCGDDLNRRCLIQRGPRYGSTGRTHFFNDVQHLMEGVKMLSLLWGLSDWCSRPYKHFEDFWAADVLSLLELGYPRLRSTSIHIVKPGTKHWLL